MALVELVGITVLSISLGLRLVSVRQIINISLILIYTWWHGRKTEVYTGRCSFDYIKILVMDNKEISSIDLSVCMNKTYSQKSEMVELKRKWIQSNSKHFYVL